MINFRDHVIGSLGRSARPAAAAASAVTLASVTLVAILSPGALAGTASPTRARGVERTETAHAAHTVSATDTGHLHLVRSPGSLLLEEGSASGTIPGTVKARCNVAATLTATFTIYTHAGSISGSGSGKLSASGERPSFGGSMTITGGAGRYAHAHGHGGFYGVFNRSTDAMTIQTTGTISY